MRRFQPNRLLKKDFELAMWRKMFRIRPKTVRNPRLICGFWTDFLFSGTPSRRFCTFFSIIGFVPELSRVNPCKQNGTRDSAMRGVKADGSN
jgi:hypothetical protein